MGTRVRTRRRDIFTFSLPRTKVSPASKAGRTAPLTPDAAPRVRIVADGLDENQVAAITVAVITHAENRRRLAAPETRAHAPGSQLFASRWLAVGRAQSQQPFVRR